ncbi:hypothetical protein Mame01_24280 [Microbispora amethystogenes]|nr:hypothetical protein Mame01_24280 [Microbispora amethystogenes]
MVEVAEGSQCLGDDVVTAATLHVRDHGDATGVMLEGGVVESLRLGETSGKAKAGSRHVVTPVVNFCVEQRDDAGPAAVVVLRDYNTLPE